MHEKTKAIYKNFWFFISITVILLVASLFAYLDILQRNLKKDMRGNITEIAEMEANALSSKLKEETQTVKAVAGIMAQYYNITDLDTFIDILDEETRNNDFTQMGIILDEGEAYFHDHSMVKNFLPKEDMEKILDGQTVIAGPIADPYSDKQLVVIASPVFVYGKPQAAIFATHPTFYYERILEVSKFGGHGYSYIVNNDGTLIIKSAHHQAVKTAKNLLEYMQGIKFEKPKNIDIFVKELLQGKSGIASLKVKGEHKFMAYMPLGVNDWYLLFVLPTEPFMGRVNQVMLMSIALCLEIILIFTLLMMHIKRTETKNKKAFYQSAFIDPLTESGNLNKLKMDLSKLLAENKEANYAMVLLDIDKFKVINELYGFRQGDMVLIHISNVLKDHLKEHETFARFSGDKFLLIIEYKEKEEIEKRIREICKEIKNCYASTDLNYEIITNCGIFPVERGLPFYLMLDRVNLACSEVKKNKSTNFAFYRDFSIKQILTEKSIENGMREALANEQFKIYFQPKVNLNSLKMEGAEILVRWQHPAKGMIMPDIFIPIFESNGFILDLDMFMLESAAKELRACIDEGLEPVHLAINFSRLHINNPKFCEEFKQTADFYKIPPNLLEAEITESTLLDNLDKMEEVIKQFHKEGYLIAIDDFGAGYSSLNVMKSLHFDTLKMDKEFLKTQGDPQRAKDIIAGTVKMMKSLGITIVAEGVETCEQAQFLKEIGCDMGQGYLFSKPVPIEEFRKMLRNNDFSDRMKSYSENK
ncbi:bifunctional diguanylate cyclase/phosphodiesterase [Candidatus Proelusimicrobium volucris]|uniref:bifunctional diguanylate cyclase/phosphodiesterase n=1 Tax=Candidatus Proelusimicrobium volucris TaxID=3416225 RepID=UPI003D1297DD